MYAIIIDGTVAELLAAPPALEPGESAIILPCGPEVQPGWRLEAGVLAPPPPAPEPDPNAGIDARIQALEATVTQRRYREAMLTEVGKEWLAGVDAQIEVLRAHRA